ncbi:FH1/FH2 domain-containing protein 3 isoform X3 [Cimex lectularius]|uniref:FH1/FH2 domain-containing protein 3 n=1 Tax=Cimex lectularius TaxID=79782 RepID=A0A8I6RA26_CIMLE|nr:FH1/FH2 domain-containing protein 3 isoform X3 [Cimex lectularius]
MSSYGSYVPWSKGSTYSRVGSTVSSIDRPSRTSYGSLPRTYGTPRASVERTVEPASPTRNNAEQPKSYTSRFSRSYSTERNADSVKPPEIRKYGGYTAPETPALRLGSSSRFGGQIVRSPISEKSPNVFGVSPVSEKSPSAFGSVEREPEIVTLITRSTSPTPPCNSSFLRAKRAEMEPCLRQEVPKPSYRPCMVNSEIQTEDPKKTSTPWGSKVQPPNTRYRGYIKPEDKPPEEKKEAPRVGGLSFSRPTDLPLPQRTAKTICKSPVTETPPKSNTLPTSVLTKSQTQASVKFPAQGPNKDFRKSILNMDLTKTTKAESSSSESDSSSESSSSEESSDESETTTPGDSKNKPPVPPVRNESKTAIAKTPASPAPVKVTIKTIPEPEKTVKPFVLRKFDSGERAWWTSNKDIPNAANSEKVPVRSEEDEKKLSKTPRIKSIQPTASEDDSKKIPNSKLLQKVPSSISIGKSDSSNVNIPSSKSTSVKEDRPKTLQLRKFDSSDDPSSAGIRDPQNLMNGGSSGELKDKTQSSPSEVKLKSNALQKSKSYAVKTLSNSKLSIDEKSSSISKSNELINDKCDSESKIPLSRSTSGLQRTGSNLSDLTSDEEVRKLVKTPSAKNLPRSPSSLGLSGKPPIKRSESKDQLEHTPGFNRIHKKLGSNSDLPNGEGVWSPTSGTRRMLVRVESGERDWWLSDEEKAEQKKKARKPSDKVWIGSFTNIDHVLGNQAPPPAAFRTPDNSSDDSDSCDDYCFEVNPDQVKIHDSTAKVPVIQKRGRKLDDTALQLYKDGDYGSYLDLDASINEQQEEFDSFNSNRKNSIVLRTQLSVRVHTIIEKLLNSEGRELRRALFSLKQIFQEDKDLVHEFVQNDGLACLIKVGSDADQNYQNYILRALGQVMLYVDGMNGVAEHPATLQWLYNLVSSKFRLVVKTALKLLLVFVEYAETNCILLVKAIKAVDYVHTTKAWSNVMALMKGYDAADTELLIYSMTLINKTLNGLPDQDMYYDQVDAIEEQGMESIIRMFMAKQGTDLDLLRQFQIYEAVLHHEDGDEKGTPLRQLDETIRKIIINRKSLTNGNVDRRKSRRFSTGNSPIALSLSSKVLTATSPIASEDIYKLNEGAGMTPSLRRRRERAERQKSFIREQTQAKGLPIVISGFGSPSEQSNGYSPSEDSNNNDTKHHNNTSYENQFNNINNNNNNNFEGVKLDLISQTDEKKDPKENVDVEDGKTNGYAVMREGTVKDLTQKLANTLNSPSDDSKNPFGDMKGIISKAKEELAKSQLRGDCPRSPTSADILARNQPLEIKKSETELHWDSLKENSTRALHLNDLDFTDLASDEERDLLAPAGIGNGAPPPPPPIIAPPPALCPPPSIGGLPPPPAPNLNQTSSKKTKKTLKLFWKEVRDDPIVLAKMSNERLLWDELSTVAIDTQKLEHLFESRAKDLITKEKQQEMNKNKEVIVLDHKRSNAINIGMTKLPPPRSIKTAILKMDATIMNREGIEKLLTMLPTEEERSKIQEAQSANPELPLGSAEQFLLTLASISELPARLKLWAFKLDYENLEKEIADPLMDLKQGMETLKVNKTFKAILGTLLSIGIFLNGSEVKGFQIEYLSKVPEVKDTVHKHTLLHHLCHMVMEKFPDSTDLYSEIGAVTRASKVDFEELAANINKMEQECKASFDHLKVISKHDGTTSMKLKVSDFLADCAERIIVIDKIHRRVIHRFHKFCFWLGIPMHRVGVTKPNELCRIISEFALEYRTTRERVIQQLEKKASHRERNKTRGKMITEVGKFKSHEDKKDAELKELLGNGNVDGKESKTTLQGTPLWRRTKRDSVLAISPSVDGSNGNLTDGDDEILETLVKTATKSVARTTPRERKRTRNADRKSLRRTLRNGLSEEDRKHLAAYIKGY